MTSTFETRIFFRLGPFMLERFFGNIILQFHGPWQFYREWCVWRAK